jgi:hypothetical protein
MNIKALFSRGYKIVQTGLIDFELIRDELIVQFEIDKPDSTIEEVHTRLLSEINYHIREIEEDSEDYFEGTSEADKNHIKTSCYRELLDLRDWLI